MAEVIRIAAAGDVHASEAIRERVEGAFERVEEEVATMRTRASHG